MGDKKNLSYVPWLDGMRGFAIIIVMASHSGMYFLQGGFIGVDIFFVLSGFLITSLIINEYDSTSSLNLKNFYIRRLLRLGPALLLLLTVFISLSILFLGKDKVRSNFIDALISLFYMTNWARAFFIHPPDYLGHTWSLSIEEQFYIFWPLTLLALLRAFDNRWFIVAIAFFIAISAWMLRIHFIHTGTPLVRLYNGSDTRADALMIGCALGVALSSGLLSNSLRCALSKWLLILSPLFVFCLIFISINKVWNDLQMYYWGFFSVGILTAALILNLFVNTDTIIHKIFSIKWVVWIGSISYGLYLWHYPIYRAMQSLGYGRIQVMSYGTLLTFFVSIFSFYLLEKPILSLKKKYSFNSAPDKANRA